MNSADVVNRALQIIGGFNNQGPVTGNPPNFDGSAAGIAAGVLYDSVVQTVARQYGWDFSRNSVALVNTTGAAPIGFAYEYFYPSNGIQLRQLVPQTIDDLNNPIPYNWVVGNVIAGLTAASGSILFPSNPTNNQSITLNGIPYIFVTGTPGPNQVHIEATTALTGLNLLTVLHASTDPDITVATYTGSGGPDAWTLNVLYNTPGIEGNGYTLAADSPATPSGATLTGGTSGQRKVIWTNIENAQALFTNQPTENLWDALFAETVVRLLASELATALPGKPETSKIAIEQAAQFQKAGEARSE